MKYVKQNALYGENFTDWKHLESYMSEWLAHIANQRLHGTTGQQPGKHYELMEKTKMQAYLTPSGITKTLDDLDTREVDKTGLISWQSNKYSVPLAYQSSTVAVASQEGFVAL